MKTRYLCIITILILFISNTSWAQLNLSNDNFTFNSIASPQTVTINPGDAILWQLSGTIPGWLSLSTTSGIGETLISIKPENNVSRSNRNASLNLTIPGSMNSRVIEISQNGAPLEVAWDIDIDPLSIVAEGTTFNLAIQSYRPWKVVYVLIGLNFPTRAVQAVA